MQPQGANPTYPIHTQLFTRQMNILLQVGDLVVVNPSSTKGISGVVVANGTRWI